jgi:hypothetical protein
MPRIKPVIFKYYQPATLLAIFAFWSLLPQALVTNGWTIVIAAIATKFMILGLERVSELSAVSTYGTDLR